MFLPNEKVVYPGHGVAKINRIIEKFVGGNVVKLYELKFLNKDMTILVPTQNASAIGLRGLSSSEKINDIFQMLAQPTKKLDSQDVNGGNWNKRHKEYLNTLRNGKLMQISEVYRELKNLEKHKELSFGEKNLLGQAEDLLAQEIAIVADLDSEEKAIQKLRSAFNGAIKSQNAKMGQAQI